jgi:hypothetical protein
MKNLLTSLLSSLLNVGSLVYRAYVTTLFFLWYLEVNVNLLEAIVLLIFVNFLTINKASFLTMARKTDNNLDDEEINYYVPIIIILGTALFHLLFFIGQFFI